MKQVELLTNAEFNRIITAGSHKIIDIPTMREYHLSFGGARNDHYDVTPTAEADATIMEQIINRVDLNLWRSARPVIIAIKDRLIAAGLTNFMHHMRIGGGNPGPKYPSLLPPNDRNSSGWIRGGHCCLYLSNSIGGAGNAPNAAVSAEANRRASLLRNGGEGGQARAAAFEAYFLGKQVIKILNAKTETEEEEMTQEKFDEMMDAWLVRNAAQPESPWSAEGGHFKEATKSRVLDGSAPRGFLTREQFAAVIGRLGLLPGQSEK